MRIGIADGAVVHRPLKLRTSGLGSCIGLVVYDLDSKTAGMVHIMLPTAPADVLSLQQPQTFKPQKYADSAIRWMIEELKWRGVAVSRLRAKMAGGAQMFALPGKSEVLRVGPRNIEAVRAALHLYDVPLLAEDVGGAEGRTIEFDSETQIFTVRTAKSGTFAI